MTQKAETKPASSQNPDENIEREKAFYFQWHILERCNLRCQHCYQSAYQGENMDLEALLGIAGQMEAALKQWQYTGRVSLTGGEPLLAPATVFGLLDFFTRSQHFEWLGILTNGTLIDEGMARRLSHYTKLREVQVSLDGSTPEGHDSVRGAGSFAKAVRGIKHLQDADVKTSVMFTLTRQNADSALEMIDLALALGVDAVTVERATPTGPQCDAGDLLDPRQLRGIYTAIAQRKKELAGTTSLRIRTSRPLWCLVDPELGGFCPAGLSCLAILHDGTVLPCRRLEVPIGNIVRDGLYRIWYTSKVLWQLRNKKDLAGECNGCQWIAKCGGCRAIAYAFTGDPMGNDPQCWKNESLAEEGSQA